MPAFPGGRAGGTGDRPGSRARSFGRPSLLDLGLGARLALALALSGLVWLMILSVA